MKNNKQGRIILVTGGTRSGKSSYAESLAQKSDREVTYIATAIPLGEEMEDRIKKHRESRPNEWKTLEMFNGISEEIIKDEYRGNCFLLDCVTIMTTNLMFEDHSIDWDTVGREYINRIEIRIKKEFNELLKTARSANQEFIFVTNELGMGIVPSNRLSRIFRDIAGSVNQLIAKEADDVYFCVSGIPTKIK